MPDQDRDPSVLKRLDAIESDLKTLKDNHLSHIERDISEMDKQIAIIATRLLPIEKFTETWTQKIMIMFIGAVGVAVGLPLMM